MREIKFRGKRTDTGEWVIGYYTRNCDAVIMVDEMEEEEFLVSAETVGQYTGMKDKNGKDIYEGDVVSCRAGEHRNGVWEYDKQIVVEFGWSESMWEMSMCDETEVIGNIHDKEPQ